MLTKSLIAKPIEAMLNEAVHAELTASHLYKHIANQMQRAGYFGAQKFFLSESADELEHYQKHADFLNDVGTVAKLPELAAHTDTIGTLRDALELAYETEMQLGKDYARWYRESAADPIVQQFLLQFLEIQRKSTGEYGDLLARLDRCGDNEAAILMLDTELGE